LQQADRFRLRRRLAIGVVAVLILIPVYMLFIRDEGSSKAPSDSALIEAAHDPAKAEQVLVQRIGDHEQGIEVDYPSDWRGQLDKGTVRVTSPDKTTVISVKAEAAATQAKSLFRAAVTGVAGDLKGAKVSFLKDPPAIAGLPSAQAVLTGKQGDKSRTALVAVARGKKHSYLVGVLATQGGGDAGVANLILARGLRLTG
jgi:hypothetical protein